MPEIIVRKNEDVPVVKMITPGRRALGEDWSEVTIAHDGNEIHVTSVPHEAPADGKAIIVPTQGKRNDSMTDFILDKYMGLAAERAAHPQPAMSPAERYALMNKWWMDYLENKIRHLRGQSTFGPGGFTQRQRVNRPRNVRG